MFAAVSRSLRDTEDYARLAREFVQDALAQNVIYGELFVSPSVWTFFHPTLDVRETVAAIVHELRTAHPRATFALIVDLTRNFGAASAMETAKLAASLTDLDVIGIGLGGDEARFPAELFADAFALRTAVACTASRMPVKRLDPKAYALRLRHLARSASATVSPRCKSKRRRTAREHASTA